MAVAEVFHQQLNIGASEVRFDGSAVPPEVLEELDRDPEARTYQYVIKAVALDAPGLREVQRRLRELAHENAELRDAARDSRSRFAGQQDELRQALIQAHDQTLRRDEEIHRLQEELEEMEVYREDARRLRLRLERITNSPPGRAYAALTKLPGLKGVRAARTTAYNDALGATDGSRRPAR
jgi:hypothetical protein